MKVKFGIDECLRNKYLPLQRQRHLDCVKISMPDPKSRPAWMTGYDEKITDFVQALVHFVRIFFAIFTPLGHQVSHYVQMHYVKIDELKKRSSVRDKFVHCVFFFFN